MLSSRSYSRDWVLVPVAPGQNTAFNRDLKGRNNRASVFKSGSKVFERKTPVEGAPFGASPNVM